MGDNEWVRSRFWLCHFLNSRHCRSRPTRAALAGLLGLGARGWLEQRRRDEAETHQRGWLQDQAAQTIAGDPAYVQALRLCIKEETHHDALTQLLVGEAKAARPMGRSLLRRAWMALRRRVGMRFELSVLLLGQVTDVMVWRELERALKGGPGEPLAADVLREKLGHAQFHAERLTHEFAAFNFVRRNLRRLRLRLMFWAATHYASHRAQGLLRELGVSRPRFTRDCWAAFESLLEAMVPYHRDQLLATLLKQRERRYEAPPRGLPAV